MGGWICSAGQTTGCISMMVLISVLVCAFQAILFLQSGIDKVVDRKGNMEWLTGHFANSPFKNMVGLNLTIITILEIAAGALSGLGVFQLLLTGSTLLAFWGILLSAVSILCLFLGQRLAKDYVGAAVLVSYFILCILGLYVLSFVG